MRSLQLGQAYRGLLKLPTFTLKFPADQIDDKLISLA